MVYGYNRTSTEEQHLDRGNKTICDFCEREGLDLVEIYADQKTGKNFDRPEYNFIKKRLRSGDTLVVSEIDRLGRNREATLKELRELNERGVRIIIIEIPTTYIKIDGLTDELAQMMIGVVNSMLIDVYATIAEAEYKKRKRRQKEGYERLERIGEWEKLGRPRRITEQEFAAAFQKVLNGDSRPCDCMRSLGIKSSSYYRYVAEYNKIYT